jgi:uracil-DNA glycosylase
MPNLKIMLALGRLAHDSVLRALGLRVSRFPFAHRAAHDVGGGVTLIDSYHCSRYNTNTGRLTEQMFFAVFSDIAALTKAEKIRD